MDISYEKGVSLHTITHYYTFITLSLHSARFVSRLVGCDEAFRIDGTSLSRPKSP